MNYKKIYDSLCQIGKILREEYSYTERHHIIPKCMGGDDSVENFTILTAKEHYLAHYLLVKIYPKNTKLLYAFGMMKNFNGNQSRNFSSNAYNKMKLSYSLAMKLNNPMKNKEIVFKSIKSREDRYLNGELNRRKLSEQEKINISNRMLGDKNPTNRFPENHNFKNNSYVKGKLCYNNGIKNKYFYPSDIIPEGFVRGNKPRIFSKLNEENYYG